ncbi:hypothetical protein Enr13x_21280 [Stieleria neptunia]|uniref:Dockerin domain-containing protein n=1 Tax=Stieleria neptunia TaxID=2527979 RepID=A0A518HN63_9BACT|nr:hypothetical protein [Stieleria neptunia]QDV42283.1 hypothetical protein Enr13x_21280 [Stieleria neptunia]
MARYKLRLLALAAAAALSAPAHVTAQDVTGQDDFGSGFSGGTPTGGNQVFSSRAVSPNNQGNFGFSGAPGVFPTSFFDYFGISDRRINFDVADDSASSFPPDSLGFAGDSGTPEDCLNFFVMSDLTNPANPSGLGQATWEFDTSAPVNPSHPYDVHRISIDMIGYGDFESDDNLIWSAGAATPPAVPSLSTFLEFGLTAGQDSADILYEVTMDGGSTYGKFFTPFFEVDEWNCLLANGAGSVCPQTGGTVFFHPLDNGGAGDDGVAFNGFILEPIAGDPNNVERAYNVTNVNGNFDELEREAYKDPLIEQLQGNLAQLDNEKQTFTFVIKETGDVLTLEMLATQNSTLEVIAFDNILVESAVLGDANGDGVLDNFDIIPFGEALLDPVGYAANFPNADPNFVLDFDCNGQLDNFDITPMSNKLLGN